MSSWTVSDSLDEALVGVTEVNVRIVGGDVGVTRGPGRCRVRTISGEPVEVEFTDGVLRITHESAQKKGWPSWINISLPGLRSSGNTEVTVELTVPEETRVSLSSVTADMVLAGVKSPGSMRSVSGDLVLSDVGSISAKTVSGDIQARGVAGDLRTNSVSGDIAVVDGSCPVVAAKTISGDVDLDLNIQSAGVYEIATVSGDVAVRTPSDPNLRIELTSLSGSFQTDFDLDWTDPARPMRKINQILGTGDARLTVKTLSGGLRLVHRPEAA